MFGVHTGLTVEAALAVLSIWCTFPYVKRQVGTRDDTVPDVPSGAQQLFKDGSPLGDQPTAAQQHEFAEWLRAVAAVVGDRITATGYAGRDGAKKVYLETLVAADGEQYTVYGNAVRRAAAANSVAASLNRRS